LKYLGPSCRVRLSTRLTRVEPKAPNFWGSQGPYKGLPKLSLRTINATIPIRLPFRVAPHGPSLSADIVDRQVVPHFWLISAGRPTSADNRPTLSVTKMTYNDGSRGAGQLVVVRFKFVTVIVS